MLGILQLSMFLNAKERQHRPGSLDDQVVFKHEDDPWMELPTLI